MPLTIPDNSTPLPRRHPGLTDPALFTRAALNPTTPPRPGGPSPDRSTLRMPETSPPRIWRYQRRPAVAQEQAAT
jgi:hypothetical protein